MHTITKQDLVDTLVTLAISEEEASSVMGNISANFQFEVENLMSRKKEKFPFSLVATDCTFVFDSDLRENLVRPLWASCGISMDCAEKCLTVIEDRINTVLVLHGKVAVEGFGEFAIKMVPVWEVSVDKFS